MFIQKLAPAFLAVVASLPATLAGTCAVVGEVRDIHGGGSQDVPATTGNGTKLTYDSQRVFTATLHSGLAMTGTLKVMPL
ncbi:hypothetical protein N7508_009173 [Penicillium antarcticum]|uniref:uncharacterized protein n=1 Tax=Penicillium antarcticum TaxID=416450 RepID=UPI002391F90B|nr:uncharacterized protein N7508_009173 [Penicillium antarcticum]KAJ5294352.1 hypothetical protein N7508_009173 [Penicillium antarcticum]